MCTSLTFLEQLKNTSINFDYFSDLDIQNPYDIFDDDLWDEDDYNFWNVYYYYWSYDVDWDGDVDAWG